MMADHAAEIKDHQNIASANTMSMQAHSLLRR